MIRWLADQLLRAIQQRCEHPEMMVAVDILEGMGEGPGGTCLSVAYCRRCGGYRVRTTGWDKGEIDYSFSMPDQNLWRGK